MQVNSSGTEIPQTKRNSSCSCCYSKEFALLLQELCPVSRKLLREVGFSYFSSSEK